MTKQTLEEVRHKIKRWQSKAKRTANMLHKLYRLEARLINPKPKRNSVAETIAGMTAKPGELTPNQKTAITEGSMSKLEQRAVHAHAAASKVSDVSDISWSEMTGEDLKVPNFLSRNPDQGTAIAATKTEIDKKKMPLSGREAEKFLREQSAKVTAKREKKNRPFQK